MDPAEFAGNEGFVTLGVDTHKDAHVAVALDGLGRRLGELSVPGDRQRLQGTFGLGARPRRVGACRSRGDGVLRGWTHPLFDERGRRGARGSSSQEAGSLPLRKVRPHRRRGSGPRCARRNRHGTPPKGADGEVEMIRVLRLARRSAVKARAEALNQLRALLDTAPEALRDEMCDLSACSLIRKASRLRPGRRPHSVLVATKLALRSVARRCRTLSEEISELDEQLEWLVGQTAPELVALKGVGTDTAASLLVAIGDNPARMDSEASFAHLCGVAPVPASSGKVVRHRLNRRGNRDANRALYVVASPE